MSVPMTSTTKYSDQASDASDIKIEKLYEARLKYPLLPWSIIYASHLFSMLPLQISTQSVTDKFDTLQLTYSIIVTVFTVYHIYITPYVFNNLQYESQEFNLTSSSAYYRTVQISFPIVISVAALVAKFTTLYMLRKHIMKLYKCIYYSDLYSSTVCVASNVRFHNILSLVLIAICLSINLAINVVRFLQLYGSNVDLINILYFNYMYFNSIQVYITELQFILLAYGLWVRFRDINISLYDIVRQNSIFYNLNYRKEYLYARILVNEFTKKPPASTIFKAPPLSTSGSQTFSKNSLNLKCNTVANLRIAHIFLCDSLTYLNAIYDYSLIFALVCLFITTLLDIYYEFFGIVVKEVGHNQIRTYLWIVQYCVRFVSVIQVCEVTSKEAKKARSLIANICNRHLDVHTKEELALFSNHISTRNIEFSAGGFFNLNTHLITSAIAAGTTYLVILVQFNSSVEEPAVKYSR